MPCKHQAVQDAVAMVAILSRWRPADDPELVEARRRLDVARARAALADAAAAVTLAAQQLRDLESAEVAS